MMKKTIAILFTFLILLSTLLGCDGLTQQTTNAETTAETQTKVYDGGGVAQIPWVGRPHSPGLNYQIYRFSSYEELLFHFSSEATVDTSVIHAEKNEWSSEHQIQLASLRAQDIRFPCIDGQRVPIRTRADVTNIGYLTSDILCMPAFFYHVAHEEFGYFFLEVQYPSLVTGETFDESKSASEVLNVLSPTYPNIHNWNDPYSYEYMTVREIQLKDQSVSALVFKNSSESEHYALIHYHGMLIHIRLSEALLNNTDFWGRFSFE